MRRLTKEDGEMIQDPAVLAELRNSWLGVDAMTFRIHRGLRSATGSGAAVQFLLADIAYNLPFLHACAVLNDVLRQYCDEGRFSSHARTLGALFSASKLALDWLDEEAMQQLIDRRNELAHDGAIIPRTICWSYCRAIEEQLRHWGVLLPDRSATIAPPGSTSR